MSEPGDCYLLHQFENGLVLLGELLPEFNSVSFEIAVPAGAVFDPDDRLGLAYLTTDMILRGAGPRDARTFLEDLENLGIIWSESVGRRFIHLKASLRPAHLRPALEIFRDVLRSPHLPKECLEFARHGLIQAIQADKDDPEDQLKEALNSRFLPFPWNRPPKGLAEHVALISWEDVAGFVERHFCPRGTLIGVAGRFDWEKLVSWVGELFAHWRGDAPPLPQMRSPTGQHGHVDFDSQQTHIAVAYRSVDYRDERYYTLLATVGILGGSSSSRLFMQLRERNGLCYGVYAKPIGVEGFGGVVCYVATQPKRAKEALAILLRELNNLAEGVADDELTRAKVQVKSTIAFFQESSLARANKLIGDWALLRRVRPIEEIKAAVDELSVEKVNAFLRDNPPRDMIVVTLGPQPVEIPCELPQP